MNSTEHFLNHINYNIINVIDKINLTPYIIPEIISLSRNRKRVKHPVHPIIIGDNFNHSSKSSTMQQKGKHRGIIPYLSSSFQRNPHRENTVLIPSLHLPLSLTRFHHPLPPLNYSSLIDCHLPSQLSSYIFLFSQIRARIVSSPAHRRKMTLARRDHRIIVPRRFSISSKRPWNRQQLSGINFEDI